VDEISIKPILHGGRFTWGSFYHGGVFHEVDQFKHGQGGVNTKIEIRCWWGVGKGVVKFSVKSVSHGASSHGGVSHGGCVYHGAVIPWKAFSMGVFPMGPFFMGPFSMRGVYHGGRFPRGSLSMGPYLP
jgi:hypothetical protein